MKDWLTVGQACGEQDLPFHCEDFISQLVACSTGPVATCHTAEPSGSHCPVEATIRWGGLVLLALTAIEEELRPTSVDQGISAWGDRWMARPSSETCMRQSGGEHIDQGKVRFLLLCGRPLSPPTTDGQKGWSLGCAPMPMN